MAKTKAKKVMIWQLRKEAAEKMFLGYDYVRDNLGGVDLHEYRKAYEGDVGTDDLNEIYRIFNTESVPEGYRGRSLSVSDIVVVIGRRQKYRYFYVDNVGFRELTWAEEFGPTSLKMKEVEKDGKKATVRKRRQTDL